MREMGWSWQDLMTAPSDLVEEIAFKLTQTARFQAKRQELNDARGKT